jgi:peptidoglycan hydrolase-like protein with peptidoglycan-binding domain
MNLTESTIEQELERFRTRDVTLSELTLAIERIQETEDTDRAKVRKTNLFLGRLAEQLNLPGMFTLPSGKHFVSMNRGRARTKSALPEYMTAEEVQPLAQRNLIPQEARTVLADLITASSSEPAQDQQGDVQTFPVEPQPNIQSQPLDSDNTERAPTSGSALERFASSGKGGLRNDPDETEAITELQAFLVNELGLDTGGTDGRYGPRTRAAVSQFQQAVTGIAVDGDAGPETIGKIVEIRRDIARIQELMSAIEESAIPIVFKSGLAQLLERELTQQERTELQQLVSKYENFRQAFPNFSKDLFDRANQTISGEAPNAQTDVPGIGAPNADTTAPTTSGQDASPATTAPGRPSTPSADNAPLVPGSPEVKSPASVVVGDEPQDPEQATFVQDNPAAIRQLRVAIRGPGTDENAIFRVLSTIRSQQQWDQLQREYQRQYSRDLVADLIGDLGGFNNNINSIDMDRYVWDPLGRAGIDRGNRINQTAAPTTAQSNTDATNTQTPRPVGNNRNIRRAQQSWDRRYASTHNPDGTPKTGADAATRRFDDRTLDLINRVGSQ